MKLRHVFYLASIATISLTSCQEKMDGSQSGEASSLPAGKKFLDPANIDTTINPADDFYSYANGAWLKTTPIPASETRWGSFNLLEDFNKKALKGLLEEAVKQRWTKDQDFRTILEAAKQQGKTLLFYTNSASSEYGGKRTAEGFIEGENKLGKMMMKVAGFA